MRVSKKLGKLIRDILKTAISDYRTICYQSGFYCVTDGKRMIRFPGEKVEEGSHWELAKDNSLIPHTKFNTGFKFPNHQRLNWGPMENAVSVEIPDMRCYAAVPIADATRQVEEELTGVSDPPYFRTGFVKDRPTINMSFLSPLTGETVRMSYLTQGCHPILVDFDDCQYIIMPIVKPF